MSAALAAQERSLSPLTWRDFLWAAGLFAGSLLLFVLLAQRRYFGDGPGLVTMAHAHADRWYYHLLYFPLVSLFLPLSQGLDPGAGQRLLSACAGALGSAGTLLLARIVGLPRVSSLLAGALLALSPAVLFFSTTVEVHVPHMAAVVLGACCVLRAPQAPRFLALSIACLSLLVAFGTHVTAVTLGPGWLCLVAFAARDGGHPYKRSQLLFGVGPLLLLVLLLAYFLGNYYRLGSFLDPKRIQQIGEGYFNPGLSQRLLEIWIWPLGALLLPLLVALLRGLVPKRLWALWAWLCLPAAFAFLFWGVFEFGAYLVPTVPFYAVIAAHALRGRFGAAAGWALLILQAVLGYGRIQDWNREFDPARRLECLAEIMPQGGQVLSSFSLAPSLDLYDPRWHESSLFSTISKAWVAGTTPAEMAALVPNLELLLERGGVVIDLSSVSVSALPGGGPRMEYNRALEAALRAHFTVAERSCGGWRFLKLEPKA